MTDKPQDFIICQYLEGLQQSRVVAAKSIYNDEENRRSIGQQH